MSQSIVLDTEDKIEVKHAGLSKFIIWLKKKQVRQATIEYDQFYELGVHRVLREPRGKVPRLDCVEERREEMQGERSNTEQRAAVRT